MSSRTHVCYRLLSLFIGYFQVKFSKDNRLLNPPFRTQRKTNKLDTGPEIHVPLCLKVLTFTDYHRLRSFWRISPTEAIPPSSSLIEPLINRVEFETSDFSSGPNEILSPNVDSKKTVRLYIKTDLTSLLPSTFESLKLYLLRSFRVRTGSHSVFVKVLTKNQLKLTLVPTYTPVPFTPPLHWTRNRTSSKETSLQKT